MATSPTTSIVFKNYALIVAGGTGARMQSSLPKQFLLLSGKPVLMHTIESFRNATSNPHIIVVLHPDYHIYWQQLCDAHAFSIPHQLVKGGETRFHSVKNGIDNIPDESDILVAVHDAVRPLTATATIDGAYKHAAEYGNAITAVKSRDSVRRFKNNKSESLVRDDIYLMQTPQIFRSSQLKKAYVLPFDTRFTDDASVVEAAGFTINLFEGTHRNIKITFPEDIALAEAILSSSNAGL